MGIDSISRLEVRRIFRWVEFKMHREVVDNIIAGGRRVQVGDFAILHDPQTSKKQEWKRIKHVIYSSQS